MANIFGGVEPPSWLQAIAQPPPRGETGAMLGTLGAGLFNAFRREQGPEKVVHDKATGEMVPTGEYEKGPRKGFLQGLYEARMNQSDPMWRVKEQSYRADIAAKIANTQADYAMAKERERESTDWAEDAPMVSPWITASPDKRKAMPEPQVKSRKGMEIIQKQRESDDRYFTQKEAQRIREETSRLAIENARRTADWDAAVSAAPADVQADIYGLPNEGWIMDEKGVRRTPGRAALNRLNEWRRTKGIPAWGLGKADAAAALQEKKTEDRKEIIEQQGAINSERDAAKFGQQKDLLTQRGEQQSQLLDKRIQGQESLQNLKGEQAVGMEELKQKGRESLAKMKAETAKAVADVKGQPSYYSARAKILAKSLEIAQQESIDNPDDEDAKSAYLDLERQFLDLYTKQRKQSTGSGSGFTPAGPPKKIGNFTVTPGK